jgi:predicted nucleic acid-binding Zn finger protein
MKKLLILPVLALTLFAACTTTATISDTYVTLENRGGKRPATFYILKGNNSEYINNVNFSAYSSYLASQLEERGWKAADYGKAKQFIFLEYGVKSFYKTEVKIKPVYDQERNVTEWVHPGSELTSMGYVAINAVHAGDYRKLQKKNSQWELLARDPALKEITSVQVEQLIAAGMEVLR